MALILTATLIASLAGYAGFASDAAGIEFADGNLAVDEAGHTDWNSFTDATVAGAWSFTRIDDPKDARQRDDQFSGGTKQDDPCPNVRQSSFGGPDGSKVDIDRIYLAQRNINNSEYLFLAWVRVPQNSQTASSHVAYEFNKGMQTPRQCANNDLIQRSEGDMLVVYDFAGGTAAPGIKLSRWKLSGACEVSNQSAPCWGDTQVLTGNGTAAGKVNTTQVGPVHDAVAGQTLGVVEFGEAWINLTAAGVFSGDSCEEFGYVTGVSRSSGNSGTAQMKDKVGPGEFEISNCGSVVVHKVDDDTQNLVAGATFSIAPVSDPTDKRTMTEIADGIFCASTLLAGDYVVTEESPPPNYHPDPVGPRTVSVVADGTTCNGGAAGRAPAVTFENERHKGSIVVRKVDEAGAPLDGAGFTITPGNIVMTPTGATGVFCADGLELGGYTVTETTVPDGYNGAPPVGVSVTSGSTCGDRIGANGQPTGSVDAEFTNSPAPGRINIEKTNDRGDPLNGATFTLTSKTDAAVVFSCTSGVSNSNGTVPAGGSCSFIDVPVDDYTLDETVVPAGHEKAPGLPVDVSVGLGDTAGAGQTINLSFGNPRLHKVIVIVCHEGTNTLAESEVTNGTGSLRTLAEGHALQSQLCALEGFGGRSHGDKDLTVNVGSHAHP